MEEVWRYCQGECYSVIDAPQPLTKAFITGTACCFVNRTGGHVLANGFAFIVVLFWLWSVLGADGFTFLFEQIIK